MKVWKLNAEGAGLVLTTKSEIESILFSSWYKMKLKRYARCYDEDNIYFKENLVYIEQKQIISILQLNCEKLDAKIEIANEILLNIKNLELHIEERSRAGIEIKHQNAKYFDKFKQYSVIVNNNMVRTLREKQMWDSFYMCMMKKSANFSVPGSGKTSSVLGVYAFLKECQNVKRIVVVCPKNAFGSWMDEFKICFGEKEKLNVFHIHDKRFKNVKQCKESLSYKSDKYNLFLFNYEAVQSYLNEIKVIVNEDTLLVYDEVHKVKRHDGKWAKSSLQIAKDASYCIAMTGTPIPNTYLDIYNLLNILYPHEYKNFFNFDTRMLRNPRNEDIDKINKTIAPFFCRTTKEQLSVPPVNEDKMILIEASEIENKLFNILCMHYRSNKLALMIRILQLESDSSLLLSKLDLKDFKYLLNDNCEDIEDIDFVDYSNEVRNLIENMPCSEKISACINLVKKLIAEDKTVIIWCIFKNSMHSISKILNKNNISTKIVDGEVDLEDRQQILEDFKNGFTKVLITNPHTLAESVSLHSVCHDAVYFEYSYNLVHLLQSKDRIHRLGLLPNQYTQYYYLKTTFRNIDGEFSMDEEIYLRLKEKEKIMLNAIDKDVVEIMPTDDEDLEMIFSELF